MDDFAAMNAVYDKIFGPHPLRERRSRRHVYRKDSPVEIDAMALEYEKSSRPERELPRMKTGDCRGESDLSRRLLSVAHPGLA
jgi:hypothetical protein